MMRSRAALRAPFTLGLALLLTEVAYAQTGHALVTLDPPDAAANSFTPDINDAGVVLVQRSDGTYIWTEGTGIAPLITDPLVNSRFRAVAINNANKVLGIGCPAVCPDPAEAPATWSQAEGLVFLPLDTASAMNDAGTIVGHAGGVPVILRPGQAPQPIPGAMSADAVNDAEHVAGILTSGVPYVWTQAGGILPIPKVPGKDDTDWLYSVHGLNNSGQVVGSFAHRLFPFTDPESGHRGVFLWSPSAGTIDLQFPEEVSDPFFEAVVLNDRGHIVVTYALESPQWPLVALFKNGAWSGISQLFESIDAPLAPLRVFAINNDGWMTGSGTYNTFPFPQDCVASLFVCPAFVLMPPDVDMTVNGTDGPLALGPGDPLNVALAFDVPGGVIDSAEVYAGFITASGIVWFHPATGISLAPAPLYQGPLTPLASAPLLSIPDVSAMPPGAWLWFVVVDNDANGTVNADYVDYVLTLVTGGMGS